MKLLVVSHSCATAANQRLYGEIQSLTGWDVTLVVPANWKDEFGNILDEPQWPELKGRLLKIPVWKNGHIILHAYRLPWKRFLREEQFQAIYVNHEPYAVATAQVCRANLRQRQPAAFGFSTCQNIRKDYPFPFSQMEKMVYRRSSFAFPITQAVTDVLRQKGYQGDAVITPLPVDEGQYFPRGDKENAQQIPRDPGQVVIGYVGRLVESKGLRTLAEALGQIASLPWKLVVAGSGEFEQPFRELLAQRGLMERTVFTGYIPHEEAPRCLSALDILVLPSETQPNWKEQFGRVITEAMACGTAVVGSDSGEIPNLIRSSKGGLVFPEKSAAELAKALQTMIQDPAFREKCASQGRAWVSDHVSLRGVTKTTAETIERSVKAAGKI